MISTSVPMLSPEIIFIWILWAWIGLFIWFLLAKLYFQQHIKKHRKSAVQKSKDVTLWYVSEKLAPIMPNFPYNYKDLTFLWKWVDYIVFDGLSTWNLQQIIFLEVKTWWSRMNSNEKKIQRVIESKRVKHEVLRIKDMQI